MHSPVEDVVQKLKALPAERLAEVENFIDLLNRRGHNRAATRAAMAITQSRLEAVWDNEDDAVYDEP